MTASDLPKSLTSPPPSVPNVLVSFPRDHVMLVTLNRPKALNAIPSVQHLAMSQLWEWYDSEPFLRCAVITGSGRAFCAGADLKEWDSRNALGSTNPDRGGALGMTTGGFGGLSNRSGKKPVIAAVNGLCFGGGMEIVVNCDLVVAADEKGVRFGLPEVKRGVVAIAGALPRLVHALGTRQRASEMALLGRTDYGAKEMKEWGLVNRVTERVEGEGGVVEEALRMAEEVASNSPDSVIVSREGIKLGMEGVGVERGTEWLHKGWYGRIDKGENMSEGVKSFVEKRKPSWKDAKLKTIAFLAAVAATLASAIELPAGVPRSLAEFREKHPYAPRIVGKRKIVQIRASADDTDDVADEFLEGLQSANNGGTLYLPKGKTFMIGKPLDLTFLNDIHVRLDGEIKFTNDTPYWQANAYRHPFQHSIMFWKWGGKNIKISGSGVLNGNGQRWWNEFAGKEILDPSNAYLRPILFYAQNATGLHIEGIHMKDSPCWTNFFVTSKDISFKDVACTAVSNNATALPKNTDFFDSLNVEKVRVERAWVDVGDDCFSPKSNATDLYINTMYCNNTHGQAMGSIGQYSGEKSFIKDVYIENVWMLNGPHGARLKTWAGPNIGYGFIDNVTFKNFWNGNNEYTAFLDPCYFNISASMCAAYPSQVNITNVLFENFSGTTSGKYGRAVARLTCSPDAVCENIRLKNFTVTSPCGDPPVIICDGIKDGIGTPCVNSTSPEATAALKATCTAPVATLPQPTTPW
ncbi:pectin lyase fold/virulence factor [Diplogelasinospora grovesii]|uniref:galacturonan 1,4-alpha-galacturonidase n=1 Tax=Diplogelasinospora grovesii TaxID=303347 RepID=A0AAN6S3Z4_9PEZI|nr:pectin lyase fold/virulence factor [Diplogelasinospora grovesii]